MIGVDGLDTHLSLLVLHCLKITFEKTMNLLCCISFDWYSLLYYFLLLGMIGTNLSELFHFLSIFGLGLTE